MGHEFTGIVDEVGSDVKKFKKGDKIVSPFTTSWHEALNRIPHHIWLTCHKVVNAFTVKTDILRGAPSLFYTARQALMAVKRNMYVIHSNSNGTVYFAYSLARSAAL